MKQSIAANILLLCIVVVVITMIIIPDIKNNGFGYRNIFWLFCDSAVLITTYKTINKQLTK